MKLSVVREALWSRIGLAVVLRQRWTDEVRRPGLLPFGGGRRPLCATVFGIGS
jgi:hypothetical protein